MSFKSTALVLGLLVLNACTTGTVTASSRDPFVGGSAPMNWGKDPSPPEPKQVDAAPRANADRPYAHALDRMPRIR